MREGTTQRHILPLAQLPPAQPKARGGRQPYRRGATAERQLLRDLQQGGVLALRSAGSAGPFDLAVCLAGGGRLLQVKLKSASPTEAQLQRWLEALPEVPSGWSSELWLKTTGHDWRVIVKDAAEEASA